MRAIDVQQILAISVTALAATILPAAIAQAAKSSVLYSFSGGSDGNAPASNMILDRAANLYGTTSGGGSSGFGTVFKLSSKGKLTVLYSFGDGKDGAYPQAALALDADGNLYGTTSEGGDSDLGTVFKLAPDGMFKVLHSFTGGYDDGASPLSGVVVDKKGNLYGTTESGGVSACGNGCGVVFEITRKGREKILYKFGGSPDGAYPLSSLLMDKSGNLYGTTLGGGVQSNFCGVGCGTVFELSPNGKSWTENVIYSFLGQGNDTTNPWANVIADSNGNLYGTATLGGNYNDCESGGCGAVFELSPGNGGWSERVLYAFSGGADGGVPYGGLLQDAKGNLYGTTFESERSTNCQFYGCGTLYRIAPDGTETVLRGFAGGATDAANSSAGLVADGKGNLFGTSQAGGSGDCNFEGQLGCGTVFRLKE